MCSKDLTHPPELSGVPPVDMAHIPERMVAEVTLVCHKVAQAAEEGEAHTALVDQVALLEEQVPDLETVRKKLS